MYATQFDANSIPSLPSINNPGMISNHEEKLYYHLARTQHRPDRITLEIGTWLGRSTQRICDGLSELSDDWSLHCYDMYLWSTQYRARALGRGADDLVNALGDSASFEPLFRALMGSRSDRITTHVGKLSAIEEVLAGVWPDELPMGLLFIDAAKGWPQNAALLRYFADRLVPGEDGSRLLFQDFLYFPAYKLIFLTQLLGALRIETYVESGTSVVMKLTDTISSDNRFLQDGAYKRISEQDIREAWARLLEQLPPERLKTQGLELCLPLMLWDNRHREAAAEEFARVELSDKAMAFVRGKVNDTRSEYRAKPLLEMVDRAAEEATATSPA